MKKNFRYVIGHVERQDCRCIVHDYSPGRESNYNRPDEGSVALTFQSADHFYALEGCVSLETAWRVAGSAPAPDHRLHAVRGKLRTRRVYLDKEQAVLLGADWLPSLWIQVQHAPAGAAVETGKAYALEGFGQMPALTFDPETEEKNDPRRPEYLSQPLDRVGRYLDRGMPVPHGFREMMLADQNPDLFMVRRHRQDTDLSRNPAHAFRMKRARELGEARALGESTRYPWRESSDIPDVKDRQDGDRPIFGIGVV
jgi:hypothetical protein